MIQHTRSAWVPDPASTAEHSLRHRYVYLMVAGTEVPTPVGKEWEETHLPSGEVTSWTELTSSTLRLYRHRSARAARSGQ